ncbi:MMS19 nucleotide excision repair protein [Venturia canescens]|uniref:MMS19 nucleotide excision repair protein n=1 Tax=Venturia canescens TaxID=32260 RepID=UPI001C9BE9A7|nr:MMS19 nucleotide excision repair protein [Venturia canescens]
MTSNTIAALVKKLSQDFGDHNTLIVTCQDIALEIQTGRCKIHSIVKDLGQYLTNTDFKIRINGVKALSLILEYLPHDYLNESEVELLSAFYCDRLKDHHSIGPATILGIRGIVKMKNLPTQAPARLLSGIFQHIRCQSELQETRRNIYLIFQILLQSRLDNLRSMGPDFVYGVISSMDGESDPRNLMLLFNILPLFIKEFPLGHLTEEMFEVIACYFPIDFNASLVNNRKKITREDLADALAPCLYAIPEFAEFCLPHVMEKLDSDRKVAKIDSLNLLIRGVSTFGSKGLKHHVDDLWPLLKKEVMSVTDQEINKLALKTVNEVVKAIADDEELRKHFVEKIFTDTRWSLCDVQLSLYWPAEKLLESVAKTEIKSCTQVLLEIVPLCLGQYSTKTSINDKVNLMETLNNFIKICSEFNFNICDVPELAWTNIPGLYLNEISSKDQTLKTKALAGLIIQKSSLKEGQRMQVYEDVSKIIDSDISSDVRNSCHLTLLAFAKLYPNEVLDILEKKMPLDIENVEPATVTRRLEAISMLAKIPEIGMALLPEMMKIAISKKTDINETAIRCLYRILGSPNPSFDIHEYMHAHFDAIDRFIRIDNYDMKILSLVSNVIRSIVRKLKLEDQQKIVDKYIIVEIGKITDHNIFKLEGILTPLKQNILIPDIRDLVSILYEIAITTENPDIVRSACRIIAVLVNKINDHSNLFKITQCLREKIVDILESEDTNVQCKRAAITLHTWLTKALVTKGSENSQDFLDYQINILRLDSSYAPQEFRTLVKRSESSITEENFCVIRIFYKQRIFQNVIESNRLFEAESRQNYLVALAYLVEEVPTELLFMHLQALVPLLVESLTLDDGQLLLSTLKTLKLLLETKHHIFLNQIHCFIPKCLQLATYKKMNVRIAALDCLLSYCKYPTSELLKYKQDVIDQLAEPLDDHKRLVRQIAVKARTRWFLVGANGTQE